jgi:hypothetical protein
MSWNFQTPNMRLWAPWVLVYFRRFKGIHLKLTEQSHRCGAVLVVSMMGSYKKKYCIRSKDMRTEFQTQCKGHSVIRLQNVQALGKGVSTGISRSLAA